MAEKTDKLAVCLDPTPAFVRQAMDWGAGCVLTHHPLLMEPKFLDRVDGLHEVVRLLMASGAWLYGAHTTLDVQPEGPVGWLARELQLADTQVLEPVLDPDGNHGPGYGLVGDLPALLDSAEFAALLGRHVNRNFWVANADMPSAVRRVAYCTGSGTSLAPAAFAAGADVFLTGDMKYHFALETDGCVIDVGHFCLEEEMMRRFADDLAACPELAGLEVRFFAGTDPLRVLTPGG